MIRNNKEIRIAHFRAHAAQLSHVLPLPLAPLSGKFPMKYDLLRKLIRYNKGTRNAHFRAHAAQLSHVLPLPLAPLSGKLPMKYHLFTRKVKFLGFYITAVPSKDNPLKLVQKGNFMEHRRRVLNRLN